MADAPELPWSDLKVCFSLPDDLNEVIWTTEAAAFLPQGWTLCETDISGAAGYVAIFRVEGVPTIEGGLAVLEAFDKIGRHCEVELAVEHLTPGMFCDLENDLYANEDRELIDAEYAYATVIEVRVNPAGEPAGTVLVEFDQTTVAFPIGHPLATIKEPV